VEVERREKMSGGSFGYAYREAEEMGQTLIREKNLLRSAFGRHLLKVAKAMHDIEWVDSGDYGEGDDVKAIQAVLGTGEQWKKVVVAEMLQYLDEQIEVIKQLKGDNK
jgi:hypothetical protein